MFSQVEGMSSKGLLTLIRSTTEKPWTAKRDTKWRLQTARNLTNGSQSMPIELISNAVILHEARLQTAQGQQFEHFKK